MPKLMHAGDLADAEFAAVAREAYDAMRRHPEWGQACCVGRYGVEWYVGPPDCGQVEGIVRNEDAVEIRFPCPFAAWIVADRWCRDRTEEAADPV